ncbi:MAG: cytochrome P460 family protein [Halocynthiibacter sp.]
MRIEFSLVGLVAGFALAGTIAYGASDAAQCKAEGDPADLEDAAIAALYECIEGAMAEGYSRQDDEVGSVYRDWAITSTLPALAASHGNRYVQTFANDIAAEQYLQFATEGFVMPEGSVLAKESFRVADNGVAKVGPLFTMTKLAEGGAPDANDWLYGVLLPNGKTMGIQQAFCSACHTLYSDQDDLAYPLEEVRIGAN